MRIYVIINPGGGQDAPILNTINRHLAPRGIEWVVDVTNKPGDGRRFATRALIEEYDLIAVYGGDGLLMEVAGALQGSGRPMAILPGGTANVLAIDLGIPTALDEALALMLDESHQIVGIDVGSVAGVGHFVLRIGLGLEAEMVKEADRHSKEWMGTLAYALAARKARADTVPSRYVITVDGEHHETTGVTCLICNSGSVGQGSLRLAPTISVADGILDVLVLQHADLATLGRLTLDVVKGDEPSSPPMEHWRGRQVEVEAIPPQTIQLDGELIESRPLSISIIPQGLRVIVPAGWDTSEE